MVLILLVTPIAAHAKLAANALQVDRKVVKGQTQVKGKFGSMWTAEEARDHADEYCEDVRKKVAHFEITKVTKKNGTHFLAICQ